MTPDGDFVSLPEPQLEGQSVSIPGKCDGRKKRDVKAHLIVNGVFNLFIKHQIAQALLCIFTIDACREFEYNFYKKFYN